MKTSHILTTLAVVAALAVVDVAAASSAENITPQRQQRGQFEEVRQAVENNDYDTWQKLTKEHPQATRMFENINADNFHLLNDIHQARQDGDMEKVKQIADELGIKLGHIAGNVKNKIHRHKMQKEVREALENRDYNAWHEAMMPPIFQHVNAENFDTFADMHEAIQSGDKDKAEELRTKLGLPEKPTQGNHAGGSHMRQK